MSMESQSYFSPSYGQLNILFMVADKLIGSNEIMTVFEFGSRYGEDTIEFARKYSGALIYGFECNPKSIPDLKNRIKPYRNIVFEEKAIADFNGTVSFFQINEEKTKTTWSDGNQGASSIYKASGKYPLEDYYQDMIKVESIRLDSFMADNQLANIDILWMDIQGAELKALEGLGKEIEKVKIIHLEVEFIEIYKKQPLFSEIDRFLMNKNFSLLGFSSKNNFSGDAIYVNRISFSNNEILDARKLIPEQRKTLQSFLKSVLFRIKYFGFRLKKAIGRY